jgi:hypothetical protein
VKVVHFKVTDNTQPEVSGMRGVFADCGLPDTPLTSLHVDATIADMKAIFFLSDVDDDLDGPFRYVCGSNHPPLTPFDDYVKRISTQAFAGTRTAAARRRLMALPPEDRQRTDFGSDLPQDHALRAQVAEAERTFYTRDVDMVLFDSRGVHRGGIVASGQRAVMQISFQGLIGRP